MLPTPNRTPEVSTCASSPLPHLCSHWRAAHERGCSRSSVSLREWGARPSRGQPRLHACFPLAWSADNAGKGVHGEKQAPWGSEARTPEGTTSITHCSRLPVLEGRYQMTWSWPKILQGLSNASPGSVLQKLKFSLSWLNAGLSRASPFLAQGTGFPVPPAELLTGDGFTRKQGSPQRLSPHTTSGQGGGYVVKAEVRKPTFRAGGPQPRH